MALRAAGNGASARTKSLEYEPGCQGVETTSVGKGLGASDVSAPPAGCSAVVCHLSGGELIGRLRALRCEPHTLQQWRAATRSRSGALLSRVGKARWGLSHGAPLSAADGRSAMLCLPRGPRLDASLSMPDVSSNLCCQDFEAFDLNKDGVISREEWEAVRAGGGDDSDKRQLTWDEVRACGGLCRGGC